MGIATPEDAAAGGSGRVTGTGTSNAIRSRSQRSSSFRKRAPYGELRRGVEKIVNRRAPPEANVVDVEFWTTERRLLARIPVVERPALCGGSGLCSSTSSYDEPTNNAEPRAESPLKNGSDGTGAVLWPAALHLSKYLADAICVGGARFRNIVELGCGTGLPGIAATHFLDLMHEPPSVLVLSDQDAKTAQENVAYLRKKSVPPLAALPEQTRVLPLDLSWGRVACSALWSHNSQHDVGELLSTSSTKEHEAQDRGFDLVLGADLIYCQERAALSLLCETLGCLLADDGVALIAFEVRSDWWCQLDFLELCEEHGLHVGETVDLRNYGHRDLLVGPGERSCLDGSSAPETDEAEARAKALHRQTGGLIQFRPPARGRDPEVESTASSGQPLLVPQRVEQETAMGKKVDDATTNDCLMYVVRTSRSAQKC